MKSTAKPARKGRAGGKFGKDSSTPLDNRQLFTKGVKEFNAARTQDEYQQVIQIFEEVIQKAGFMSDASKYKGRCYLEMGIPYSALLDFQQAIKNDEKNSELYNYSGQCLQQMEQWDDALKMYNSAIELDRFEGKYYYNRAHVKAKLNQYEEAIKDFEKAIQNPSDAIIFYARYNKGICLRKVGHLDQSIEQLKKAVELKPENANAHNNLGLSFFERRDFDEALGEYTQAIRCVEMNKKQENVEDEALYYNNRGLAHYKMENLDAALDDMNKAIELCSNEPAEFVPNVTGKGTGDVQAKQQSRQRLLLSELNLQKGNVHYDRKEYKEAHIHYDLALEIEPNNPRYWHSKGLAFQGVRGKENVEAAIRMFRQALVIDEDYFGSRFHLGLMLHQSEQYHEALKCFSNVLGHYSQDDDVYIQ